MSAINDVLDAPWDVVEFAVMIEDLKKFLDLTERNLDGQFDQEIQRIEGIAETEGFEFGEEEFQLKENAERRFKAMLPLLARYGALVSLVTSVEWSVRLLESLLLDEAKQPISKGNPTVQRLSQLNALTRIEHAKAVREFEALVHVRNCIAHNAGSVKGYKHANELPGSVALLAGFSLGDVGFLGMQVCIDRGALDRYIDKMDALVVKLFTECHKQGHMRRGEIRIPAVPNQ